MMMKISGRWEIGNKTKEKTRNNWLPRSWQCPSCVRVSFIFHDVAYAWNNKTYKKEKEFETNFIYLPISFNNSTATAAYMQSCIPVWLRCKCACLWNIRTFSGVYSTSTIRQFRFLRTSPLCSAIATHVLRLNCFASHFCWIESREREREREIS